MGCSTEAYNTYGMHIVLFFRCSALALQVDSKLPEEEK